MAIPLVIYGSENWALNIPDRRWIEIGETTFL
jgi:hypothetical protein